MSSEKTTEAIVTAEGDVLLKQADGTYRRAKDHTDYSALRKQNDASIDYSDLPEADAEFWRNAEIAAPQPKKSVHLRVDADVLEWFKAQGKGHLTRMNTVLRSYMQAHKRGN